jgi:3-(3-hydroxy-phenyl)propionate hydroxylase
MNLPFEGHTFEEKFLIVDVEMEESPFTNSGGSEAAERWFWFEPDFHHGNSTLLHKQPDNIYRIDFQLQPDADEAEEKREENVARRLRAMVGDKPFTIDWMSIYRFTCAKLDRFVHNRVLFVGDSAHVVSPFGARGGNGGVQDVDNLGWKLAAILKGDAHSGILDTYCEERRHGSTENILNSSRSTNFMTPKSPIEKLFRDEVLALAKATPFARRLINSGRLSLPCSLEHFAPDTGSDDAPLMPGLPAIDAPLSGSEGETALIHHLGGAFIIVSFGDEKPEVGINDLCHLHVFGKQHEAHLGAHEFADLTGLAFARYGEGLTYLFRPDAHVAGVWKAPDTGKIQRARALAMSNSKTASGVAPE